MAVMLGAAQGEGVSAGAGSLVSTVPVNVNAYVEIHVLSSSCYYYIITFYQMRGGDVLPVAGHVTSLYHINHPLYTSFFLSLTYLFGKTIIN
jgi:hypothetical protein